MNESIINEVNEKMKKAIEVYENRLKTVRAGRANPSSLDGVFVEYYGSKTPLKQLATISVPEATQLLIKPFDKGCLKDIERAIFESNLGYTPNNDGETVRIVIPALTEERRKELTKQVKAMSEDAKVSIRNIRHEGIDNAKKLEVSDEEVKEMEKEIQDLVNSSNKKIEEILKTKEQELLTV